MPKFNEFGGDLIAVRVPIMGETTSKDSLIIRTQEAQSKESEACSLGVVTELGPRAYVYDSGYYPRCKIGDAVWLTPYSGKCIKSKTGKFFTRLVNPQEIYCLVTEDDEIGNGSIEFLREIENLSTGELI